MGRYIFLTKKLVKSSILIVLITSVIMAFHTKHTIEYVDKVIHKQSQVVQLRKHIYNNKNLIEEIRNHSKQNYIASNLGSVLRIQTQVPIHSMYIEAETEIEEEA